MLSRLGHGAIRTLPVRRGQFRCMSAGRRYHNELKAIELVIPKEKNRMRGIQWTIMTMGFLSSFDMTNNTAKCASDKDDKNLPFDWDKIQNQIHNALEQFPKNMDQLQTHIEKFTIDEKFDQISWGFVLGACSGFTMKKVSKFGAFLVGLGFIGMQCASYNGYVNVNYEKVQKDITAMLDRNKDGTVNSKDLQIVYQQVMNVLEYSMPAGSGFGVGFVVGFRAA